MPLTTLKRQHILFFTQPMLMSSAHFKTAVENVVSPSFAKRNRLIVLYKDADGLWEGFDYEKQAFVLLSEPTMLKAMDAFLAVRRHERNIIENYY